MKKAALVLALLGVCSIWVTAAAGADGVQVKAKVPKDLAGLAGPFDLAGERLPEVRYYVQESRVVRIGFDGKRTGMDTYTFTMRIVPAALSGKGGDECTVKGFLVQSGGKAAETIVELAGWTYLYKQIASGIDEKGQVFGIPHAKFENLTTSGGVKLDAIASYSVYNSFIDFHSFCDVLAKPVPGGAGIQDLKLVGQAIRHAAAFTEPPVNLGQGIKEGSVFRNGDVRMVFKGLSLVDGAACAVIGYDSGESTLKMIVPIPGGKDVVTEGGSEYIGDIQIDLATRWVRKVTLDEFIITETRLPAIGSGGGPGQKMPAYTVRHLLIRMIGREEYEKDQPTGK